LFFTILKANFVFTFLFQNFAFQLEKVVEKPKQVGLKWSTISYCPWKIAGRVSLPISFNHFILKENCMLCYKPHENLYFLSLDFDMNLKELVIVSKGGNEF
jgi:hypothetical protein